MITVSSLQKRVGEYRKSQEDIVDKFLESRTVNFEAIVAADKGECECFVNLSLTDPEHKSYFGAVCYVREYKGFSFSWKGASPMGKPPVAEVRISWEVNDEQGVH